MNVQIIRPKASELVFHLFGRSLHPELFEIFAARRVRRDDYEATVMITDCSHVVTWWSRDICLSEVAAPHGHPLPKKRRLLIHRLQGERNHSVECAGGTLYRVSFQLELLPAEVFWIFHDELAREQARNSLLYQFRTSSRIASGPLSYVRIEPRDRSLLVQGFHTFPDDYAVVKTQSLFELPVGWGQ